MNKENCALKLVDEIILYLTRHFKILGNLLLCEILGSLGRIYLHKGKGKVKVHPRTGLRGSTGIAVLFP